MLTVKEVAKLLKIHPMTVYRLIKSRELKAISIGKRRMVRIREKDLTDLIQVKKK